MRWWLERRELIRVNDLPPHPIYERMSILGEVRVYDLTAPPFDGCCLFAVYFGDGNPVWFSSGLAFSTDPNIAYQKALFELWQIYLYVYGVAIGEIEKEKIIDEYQREFLEYDSVKTKEHFYNHEKSISFSDIIGSGDIMGQLSKISKISEEIYLYQRKMSLGRRKLNVVKVFSPDFFLHIKPTAKINFPNKFSLSFDHLDSDRMKRNLPFP